MTHCYDVSIVEFEQLNASWETNNCCKKILQLPNLLMLIKQGSRWTPRNLALAIYFGVFIKCKSASPALFNSCELLSSAYDRVKLFPEIFSESSILNDSFPLPIFLPVLPSGTNLKLYNYPVTPKMPTANFVSLLTEQLHPKLIAAFPSVFNLKDTRNLMMKESHSSNVIHCISISFWLKGHQEPPFERILFSRMLTNHLWSLFKACVHYFVSNFYFLTKW